MYLKQSRIRIIQMMLLSTLALGQHAVADTAPESDIDKLLTMSLTDLMNIPIVTASRLLETRNQTPANIMVITREQIRERRYKNLADLLEDLPGVDFMRGTKSSAYNNFAVQGNVGPSRLLIMLDGVRIANPVGGTYPVADNFALYEAKQVEVLFGPASALYGADAVAGVVNIITDHAGRQQGGWASVGAGNFGNREASFMAGLKTKDQGLALDVGGHWQRADRAALQNYYPTVFAPVNATTFGGAVVVPAAQRESYIGDIGSYSLFARMDIDRDLTFGFYRNGFRSLTSTGDKPSTALYLDNSRWITKTDTGYSKYRFDVTSNLSGELVADYSNMEVDPQAKYTNIYTNFTNGYSYVLGNRYGLEQNLNWKLSEMNRVEMGVGYEKYYAIQASSLPSPYNTSIASGAQGLIYPNTNIPITVLDTTFNNISAYAEMLSEWNSRFSTTAGLRYDHRSDFGKSLTPRIGMVFKASEQHLFKVLYGEAFRAPSPEESLNSFGTFSGIQNVGGQYIGTAFHLPNLNIQPEKSKTLSLTWDWRPQENLNVTTDVYQSQIQNLIINMPTTAVNTIPGAILVAPETTGNAGNQTQTGVDLMVQSRYKISSDWTADLWSSASWIGGQLNEINNVNWDLRYVTSRKLKLGTTLHYLDRVSITPQILLIGRTNNGRKSAIAPERLETPGYALTNLHVGVHKLFDTKATLWLDVYNVFDIRYYAAGGSGSLTFFNMPQQPRTGMLSVEYQF